MKKSEAIAKYGKEVVEKACDMHETNFGKVLFEEDCEYCDDIPLSHEQQIDYLERAYIALNGYSSWDQAFNYPPEITEEDFHKFEIGEIVGVDVCVGDPDARAIVIDDYKDTTYCIRMLTNFINFAMDNPSIYLHKGQEKVLQAGELIKL